MLTPAEVMQTAVKTLDDKKASDICVLKTGPISVLADYFIICTASSSTQVKTLLEETSKRLSELGEPPIHTEGYRGGGWVLLDFGCVVVHIFLEDVRKFYDLERLWADAERMDVSEILK
ncbi:MAG: ribosome silencing factor [Oscillospiraceae bacterium]|jgi:ribosome-associated protein|nr:ribosome silencing factor [Oscillospiraceae bacterium]